MPLDPGSTSIPEFHAKLKSSRRILALCGAGLSEPSGLSTYLGPGAALWSNERAQSLASSRRFETDPDLVWLFYGHRRHAALKARPNPAHEALAKLAHERPEFLCLTQNIDGLLPRAGHPTSQIRNLHGSLFDLRCVDAAECGYVERDNFDDPLCPALAPAAEDFEDLLQVPLLDPGQEVARVPPEALPHCPKCGKLLRTAVVQFGEELDARLLEDVTAWIDKEPVDLILVIGTTAMVWPAAGFVVQARKQGAALAVVNVSADQLGTARDLKHGDFAFIGDVAELLPKMLEPIYEEK
ncbi:Sir2 family protein [Biscogniauxia sp. FL1348]|nr:Sir2 family protein [Biscogniauxia sp. FL1348]